MTVDTHFQLKLDRFGIQKQNRQSPHYEATEVLNYCKNTHRRLTQGGSKIISDVRLLCLPRLMFSDGKLAIVIKDNKCLLSGLVFR